MLPIEKRCAVRDTHAFVTPETVDALAAKMIGIVGDRRITKMHHYLGKQSGTPRLFPGLRLWHGGFDDAVRIIQGRSVGIHLASQSRSMEGISFSIGQEDETENQDGLLAYLNGEEAPR